MSFRKTPLGSKVAGRPPDRHAVSPWMWREEDLSQSRGSRDAGKRRKMWRWAKKNKEITPSRSPHERRRQRQSEEPLPGNPEGGSAFKGRCEAKGPRGRPPHCPLIELWTGEALNRSHVGVSPAPRPSRAQVSRTYIYFCGVGPTPSSRLPPSACRAASYNQNPPVSAPLRRPWTLPTPHPPFSVRPSSPCPWR